MTADKSSNSVSQAQPSQNPDKPPLPLWRKIALGFVILAMFGVLCLLLAAFIAEKRLSAEIHKIAKAGEPTKFPEFVPLDKSAEDANKYYILAVGQIRSSEITNISQINAFYRTNMISLPTGQFPGDLREKVAEILNRAKPIFDNIDKGSQLPLSQFDIGVLKGNQILKARGDSVQAAVFLNSLRTLDLILANNPNAAADSIISSLKLLRIFDSFPTFFVQGRKMISIGLICSDIQLLLSRCSPSGEKLSQIQTLLQQSFPADSLKKSLIAERILQLELARNFLPKNIVSQYLASEKFSIPERFKMPPFTWHRMRFFLSSSKYLRDTAWLIKISSAPWPRPLDEVPDEKISSAKPNSIIPNAVLFSRLCADTIAAAQSTSLAIALERYHKQKGKLPDTFTEISPDCIESIPLDPFTGKSLLYTHDDSSFTVYSTGINRIDDKGALTPKQGEQAPLDTGITIRKSAAQ